MNFIKLTACYSSDDEPDYEELGIKPNKEDFDTADWDDVFISFDAIATIGRNKHGYTNLQLFNGDVWTVREKPDEILEAMGAVKDA